VISSESSLVDVAFTVCTALDRAGILAVLVGGSAATYYAPQKYQSRDIDFVIKSEKQQSRGSTALASLGFSRDGETYIHPETRYTLDFPAGPLRIGSDAVSEHEAVRRDGEVLYVLSRTDCVRDRLAAFYFWDDGQSLLTALDVARSGEIDVASIEQWSDREHQQEKYQRFVAMLSRDKGA